MKEGSDIGTRIVQTECLFVSLRNWRRVQVGDRREGLVSWKRS